MVVVVVVVVAALLLLLLLRIEDNLSPVHDIINKNQLLTKLHSFAEDGRGTPLRRLGRRCGLGEVGGGGGTLS